MRELTALVSPTRLHLRAGLTVLAPRALAVGVLLVLLTTVTTLPAVRHAIPSGNVTVMLALVSVACGVMAAILSGVLGQLTGEARATWIYIAIALYSVLGVPAATIGAAAEQSDAALGNVRLFAHAAFVVLIFVAAFGPRFRSRWDSWAVLLLAVLLTILVAALGGLFPVASLAVTTNQAVRTVLAGAWLLSGLSMVRVGWTRCSVSHFRIGMGFTVVAIAHTVRLGAGQPIEPLGLTFTSVRLLGMGLLLLGTMVPARRALRAVHHVHSEQQEELRLAQIGLQQVAERDHELRNGLAGLAGVTALLDSDSGTHDPETAGVLREAVTAELARLDGLLRSSTSPDGRPVAREYSILPVLRQLVALQRGRGMDIRLDTAERDLRATGNPSVLAQVVTNLLANCARHAPGSPVRVQARQHQDTVVIRVSDSGPGVPARFERRVFELGTHGPASTGQGFGLHICRRLIEAESGVIYLRPASADPGGCTVVIELPAVETSQTVPAPAPRGEVARAPAQRLDSAPRYQDIARPRLSADALRTPRYGMVCVGNRAFDGHR